MDHSEMYLPHQIHSLMMEDFLAIIDLVNMMDGIDF